MKNIIFVLLVFFNSVCAMEEKPLYTSYSKKRNALENIIAEHIITPTEKRIIGYDPHLTFVEENYNNILNTGLGVWLHGFGGNQTDLKIFKSCFGNSNPFPGDYITFNFPDWNIQNSISAITRTSFGQETEIIPTIYALNHIASNNILDPSDGIDLEGISRGSCVLINSLAALCRPSSDLDKKLQRLFIDSFARASILRLVENGVISLWWPLRDLEQVIKNSLEKSYDSISSSSSFSSFHIPYNPISFITNSLSSMLTSSLSFSKNISVASSTSLAQYISIPIVTSYKPWKETVGKSLQILQSHKAFKCIVMIQPEDQAVSNKGEADYFDNLPTQKNDRYLIVGHSGGHVRTDRQQIAAINAYKKKYGRSYTNDESLLKQGNEELKKGQPDNTNQYIQEHYNNY